MQRTRYRGSRRSNALAAYEAQQAQMTEVPTLEIGGLPARRSYLGSPRGFRRADDQAAINNQVATKMVTAEMISAAFAAAAKAAADNVRGGQVSTADTMKALLSGGIQADDGRPPASTSTLLTIDKSSGSESAHEGIGFIQATASNRKQQEQLESNIIDRHVMHTTIQYM